MTNEKTGIPPPEHSPKLQMAAAEIKEILKRYDIAGVAVLHTPGFKEVINRLDPDYSCIKVDDYRHLKINKPIKDPLNPELAAKKVADTVNMIAHLQMTTSQLSQVLSQTLVAVRMSFGMMPPGPRQTPPNFINGKKRK